MTKKPDSYTQYCWAITDEEGRVMTSDDNRMFIFSTREPAAWDAKANGYKLKKVRVEVEP